MGLFDKFAPTAALYNQLENAGANPFNVAFEQVLSPTEARIGDRAILLLGTNNYLGLTYDPAVMAKAIEAIELFGTGTTGSRIANGSYDGHIRLERALAGFYGRKHAMVFSTGYQANAGVLSTLAGKNDHLILDADSHASIYDGSHLGHAQVTRFRHNDPDDLAKRLRRLAGMPGDKVVVVEGIYSMLGDTAPLREFVQVKKEWGAYLVVDEAHSLGVLGETGRGLAEAQGVEADVDFIVGTFSKSLGGVGGFCVSDLDGFDILRVTSRPYMFTASLPPSVVAATTEALHQLRTRPALRRQLRDNTGRLYAGLADLGFSLGPEPNPVVSAIMPSPEAAFTFWTRLLEAGLYTNVSLPPATPKGMALLRSSVSAAHTLEQIDHAVDLFAQIGREMGLIAPAQVRAAQ
ncbi:MAG: aminotransferase class I/II-fold pyridoxal phosphate-dependent enzyme [Alphaproteobacteria bacterium]|nr:aminotransferase class I/II-fold pyridoxal phosphate-dependent enzyme [Alphaproteobacteria bacterium]MBU6471391.1 aminotransferase class I/II-fold pyridoxal phosphate-dependent enzyme [Alphaproteobacteria bacterium]MDE2011742.1 aminotransferase class I/II-fold pyridoxal phosphate-dependent enzyme [Alphaproteobacteria bacterium]MDE2072962.1 aminotransferase class I/II-fold pyridoxal phosphate-dependent enzyme [Alphaproteobacteria bacterium]MDE2351834.1 aminotransferase class I/II-fold pyridox